MVIKEYGQNVNRGIVSFKGGNKMRWYLYGNSILTEGQMHVVWMENHMKEHKNFAKWLETQQKIS